MASYSRIALDPTRREAERVRARLIDPLGAFWRRMLLGFPSRARGVDVELGSGSISFRDSLLVRRIRARDVIAASTARTPTGVALSLVTRWRSKRPVTLEVANDAEAAEIRHALGIGHHGFGRIGLPTDYLAPSLPLRFVRLAAGIASVGAVAQMLAAPPTEPWSMRILSIAPIFIYAFLPFLVMTVLGLRRRVVGPGLVLAESLVQIRREGSRLHLPYSKIREVYADDRGLRLALADGTDVGIPARASRWSRLRPSREEIEVIAAQIHSAVQRTRGAGELAPAVPLRVADLAKIEEDAGAWLARLDATAAVLGGDGGYRGAAFDESDLWKTVDSADAPAELRAAAARVLVRAVGDSARAKLDEILPRVRVADDERRIRIALDDDTERAAEAWTKFEKHERRRAG